MRYPAHSRNDISVVHGQFAERTVSRTDNWAKGQLAEHSLKMFLLRSNFYVNSWLKMHNYSTQELADVIFAYGNAYGNASQAAQIYQERYPDRVCPHYTTFTAMFARLRETQR